MGKTISQEKRDAISKCIKNGITYTKIAEDHDVSVRTVYRIAQTAIMIPDTEKKPYKCSQEMQAWLRRNWHWTVPQSQPNKKSNFRTPYTCQRHPWS